MDGRLVGACSSTLHVRPGGGHPTSTLSEVRRLYFTVFYVVLVRLLSISVRFVGSEDTGSNLSIVVSCNRGPRGNTRRGFKCSPWSLAAATLMVNKDGAHFSALQRARRREGAPVPTAEPGALGTGGHGPLGPPRRGPGRAGHRRRLGLANARDPPQGTRGPGKAGGKRCKELRQGVIPNDRARKST